MSIEKIEIKLAHFNAVSLFTAHQDVRYYLDGIAINNGHIVATNGHYLAAIPCNVPDGVGNFIIPNDVIKKFLKSYTPKQKRLMTEEEKEYGKKKNKRCKDFTMLIEIDTESNKGVLRSNSYEHFNTPIVLEFTCIDGRFPNWKQTVPASDATEYHGFYNWDYMALFSKASRILGDYQIGRAVLKENSTNGAKVLFPQCKEFIGVIMPMRY